MTPQPPPLDQKQALLGVTEDRHFDAPQPQGRSMVKHNLCTM
jgi:hypothetical protein